MRACTVCKCTVMREQLVSIASTVICLPALDWLERAKTKEREREREERKILNICVSNFIINSTLTSSSNHLFNGWERDQRNCRSCSAFAFVKKLFCVSFVFGSVSGSAFVCFVFVVLFCMLHISSLRCEKL